MCALSLSKDRTATIPIVVPMSWVDRLNAAAMERGITRSQLIRDAVDAAVFAAQGEQAKEGVPHAHQVAPVR
jgi:metal-responsive CopG/Arc/MetJ family transcriptional regulator